MTCKCRCIRISLLRRCLKNLIWWKKHRRLKKSSRYRHFGPIEEHSIVISQSPEVQLGAGSTHDGSSRLARGGGARREEDTVGDGSIYDRARDPPGQRSVYVPPGDEKKESYRLSTFIKFPPDTPVTPRDLSKAGFYYTGYKDRVKCFSCGLCVENWVVGDDVTEARWHRSNCDYKHGRPSGNVPIGGGIFSRFLQNQGRSAVETPRARQNISQPVQQVSTANQPNEVPMDEDVSNISSTHTATAAVPPSRFLGPDFQFATINSIEHENLLRSLNLKLEVNRLDTYRNWPSSIYTVAKEDLARSGFFYLGNLDRTQCFSCGGVLRNWTHGDDVDEEHRRHFGHCLMARGIEQGNVPLNPEIRRRTAAAAPIEEPADPNPNQIQGLQDMFPCDDPVNPHMRSETRRLETFDQRWPGNIRATPAQISRAGFFYLGERDRVKCWYCNGGLQNWDFDDEPWTEHAKWFPTCEFLLQRKGPDYVHAITAAFPNLRRPALQQRPYDIPPDEELGPEFGNPRRHSPPPPIIDPQEDIRRNDQKLRTAMQSEIVRDILGMGFAENAVRRVVRRKIANSGSAFETADELLEALNTQGPGDSDDEDQPPRSPITMTAGNTRVNIGPNVTANNVIVGNRRIDLPTPSSSHGASQSQTPMEMETNAPASSSAAGEETSPAMQKRLRELQEERMCKVCLDRPADIVFVPCGHLCCCYNCAGALRKCPVCRKKIDKSIRTYMS